MRAVDEKRDATVRRTAFAFEQYSSRDFFFSFFVPVALSFDYLRLVPETPSTLSNFFPRLSLVEDRFTAEPS